jgi:PAS domain-containing protein
MWIFDDRTLFILDVNEAAIAKYGWSRREFLAMTIEDLRPPKTRDFEEYRRVCRTIRPRAQQDFPLAAPDQGGTSIEVESTWLELPYNGVRESW